jgi:hypothetical protein
MDVANASKKPEVDRQYSFDEYLKAFTPDEPDEQQVRDADPEEIGREIATEALKELQMNLSSPSSGN